MEIPIYLEAVFTCVYLPIYLRSMKVTCLTRKGVSSERCAENVVFQLYQNFMTTQYMLYNPWHPEVYTLIAMYILLIESN